MMNKKHILSIAGILVCVLLLDFIFGQGMDYLSSKAKGGDTFNNYYINQCLNDSIVIFGSSRANHHYDTGILEKELKTTAYNAGIDGNGIILAYCFLNNILHHGEKPQVVIYDFFLDFDLHDNDDRQAALKRIRPFYKIPGIKEIINDIDKNEYYKLHSASYRYNSIFLQIASDAISPKQNVINGYKPLNGSITNRFANNEDSGPGPVDSIKVKYLNKFIDICDRENISLIFVTSPSYHKIKDAQLYHRMLKEYTGNRDLIYLDFRNNPTYTGNDSLFVDPAHMNHIGAERFTLSLIDSLKSINTSHPIFN